MTKRDCTLSSMIIMFYFLFNLKGINNHKLQRLPNPMHLIRFAKTIAHSFTRCFTISMDFAEGLPPFKGKKKNYNGCSHTVKSLLSLIIPLKNLYNSLTFMEKRCQVALIINTCICSS